MRWRHNMEKDNKDKLFVFSKNYFIVIIISIILTCGMYGFYDEAYRAVGQGPNYYPGLMYYFFLAGNILIGFGCSLRILLRKEVQKHLWVLIYFIGLFVYIFVPGQLRGMKHLDPEVRRGFASALGSATANEESIKKSIPLLLKMLNDENAEIRLTVVGSLTERREKQAVDSN